MGKRTKNIIFSLLIFSCGIFAVDYFATRYESQRCQAILSEYENLNCENMKAKFELDLQRHQLKYFSFGMCDSENLNKNLKNLDIENFHQGCVLNPLNCYNQLVEKYLLKNRNTKISDLY